MNFLSIVWDVDPIAFTVFGLPVAYYGICWVAAFVLGWYIIQRMVVHEGVTTKLIDSAFMYMIVSCVIGSRLGHVLFYEPAYYLENPLEILNLRAGGMASHGAALGFLVGVWLFSRKWKTPFIWFMDRLVVVVASGGAIIRFGNLMNSEIFGDPTTLPWGFEFVHSAAWQQIGQPVHPTQLYEAFAYVLLFVLLMAMYHWSSAPKRRGLMFGVFLIGCFGARFAIECIKLPQVSFESSMTLDMGQLLSIPFIITGIIFVVYALRHAPAEYENLPKEQETQNRQQRRHPKK